MKKINLKEHTDKYIELSKKAASGIYPNKKVAKVGTKIGLGVGVALLGDGIYGLSKDTTIGLGFLIGGTACLISNIINLKRIEKR